MVLFVLESMDKLSGICRNLHGVLKSLADLFVLCGLMENSGSFIEVTDIISFTDSLFVRCSDQDHVHVLCNVYHYTSC